MSDIISASSFSLAEICQNIKTGLYLYHVAISPYSLSQPTEEVCA